MEAGALTMNNEFIDAKAIADMLSIKPKSIVYVMESDDKFPRPVVLSPRIKRWRKQEVEDWLKQKLEQK
jgi:predicted DNA-binding transcriptional regulator AlpA